MLINGKDKQKESGQLLKFDLETQEGLSIFQQPLDDKQGLPSCYLFEGCWIELNLTSEQLWQAFIHSSTSDGDVFPMGTYSNRIQAAIKAEQLIKKWKSFKNQAAA